MTREIIDINDFTILVEEATSDVVTTDSCQFDEPVIAVAFYGEGNVDLTVKYGNEFKAIRRILEEIHRASSHKQGTSLFKYIVPVYISIFMALIN